MADDPYLTHQVVRETRPADRMHQYDPHLAGLVFEYVRTRLSFTDTPLDHPAPPEPILAALRIAGSTILEMEVGPADLEQVFLRIMREPSVASAGSVA